MSYIEIGPAPTEESCAQLGEEDYRRRAMAECGAYKRQIERSYPELKETGCEVLIRSNRHDFGAYFEVVIKYTTLPGQDVAYWVEADGKALLREWDDEARNELKKTASV